MTGLFQNKIYGVATIGERGQVVIPAEIRKSLKAQPGDKLIVLFSPDKKLIGLIPEGNFSILLKQASKVLSGLKKRSLTGAGNRMRQSLRLSLLLLILFLVIPNTAKAEEVLTWKECVKEALRNNPDLISAQEVVKQSKANKAIAISDILPQISTELSEKTSKSTANNATNTYSYGITAQQLLFDGFKTPYNIAAAAKNVKSSQYDLRATSSDIRLRLRTAFVELLKAQELLAITEDIFARRKQNAELVRLLYEGGREHRGSLLTALANFGQAEFEVTQAKRSLNAAQRQLCTELGRTQSKPIRAVAEKFESINAKLEKPNFDGLAAGNPSLESLIAKKDAAMFGLKSARADFFPQIYANAAAGRSDSEWPPTDDNWSVGVTLTFPIFEGGRRLAGVSKAKAILNQAQADEKSGRNNLILKLEQAWINWQNALDTVNVQKNFLQAYEERSKIAQAQYSNGLISFDNWTIIEDDLVRAKKSFLDAQASALIAQAQWIQAQGGQLENED